MEVKEKYQVNISNKFTALESLVDGNVEINRSWESIKQNESISRGECRLLLI